MTTATTHSLGDVPTGFKLLPLDARARCTAITGAGGAATISIGTENPTYANIRTGTAAFHPTTVDAVSNVTLSGTTAVDGTVTLWIQVGGGSTSHTVDWIVFGLLVPA